MKKIIIIVWILFISNICLGQFSYEFGFFLPGEWEHLPEDGSGVDWTATNVTKACTFTKGTAIGGSAYTDNTFIGFGVGEWAQYCQEAAVGDDVTFSVTVIDPSSPYLGETLTWSGKIGTSGSTDVQFTIEVSITITSPQAFCEGETGHTVLAEIKGAPADIATAGYTIDWGNPGISTSGTLSTTGATGAIDPATVTGTLSGIQAKLKKPDGTVIATSAAYTVTVNKTPTLTVTPENPSICSGTKAELTASLSPAGTVYEWKKDGVRVGTNSKLTTVALPPGNATYTVTGKSADGCPSDEKTVTVTVKQAPTVSLAAEKTDACSGETQTLRATPSDADKYIWTNASGSASTASVAPPTTTTFGVIAEKDGCQSAKAEVKVTVHTVSVTLSPNPPSVNYGGKSVITASATFDPNTNSAANYNWTQGDIDGQTSGPSLTTVTSNGLTTDTDFKVIVTDNNLGCTGEKSVKVKVTGSALAVNPTGGGTFCTGALPTTLEPGVSGGAGEITKYEWKSNPTGLQFSNPNVEKPQVLATSNEGVYTVTVSVTKGGETKDGTLSLTVNKTPDFGAITANPSSISEGSASQLTLASVDPTTASLKWSSSNGGPLAGTSGLSVSTGAIATAGTYNYTVTADNNGCENTATTSVTVTAAGAPLAVNPQGGGTVCTASLPKTLNAGISGGTGALDIEWTVPAGLNLSGNKIENPQVLNTSTPGTYNVSVKVTKGSETQTGTLTLVINETPKLGTVSANPSSSFAVGGSAQLTLSNVTPTGTPLTWSGGPLEATTGLSVSTGVINTVGSYTYTVTADNATCTAKKTVTVTVTGTTPTPDLVINTPTVPPSGSTNTPIEGSVTVSGGDGDYTYDWSCPDPTVNIVDKGNGNVEITSSTAGPKEVCVEVTDGKGDTDKKCFNVIVTDPSSVNLVMSVDKKCAYPGEFLTLTITGSGADSYSFVLRDKSNNPVLTVTDKTSWETYKVYTTAEGTYKITDFKYKIGGVESNGTAPNPIEATFNIVPNVYAQEEHLQTINNCRGDQLTLKGTGDPGLQYTWDKGVTDGVPFIPATTGTYTVTGTNPATGCKNTSTVNVTVNQKPTVTPPPAQEICLGELVTLTATGSTDAGFTWNNGVINSQPFKPSITSTYEVTATNAAGCTATATTTVTVNQPPHIVRTSRNPRNIAIGKDVYFALTAEGKNLTYQWKKKENGIWVDLADITNNTPIVIGSKRDSLSLLTVPQSWDGSEFRCVVTGDCGKDSTEFQLGVRECFEIKAELVMYEGIIPDEQPGNNIDGWYCRGQRIALKAIITSDEGYDIEGAHYKWTIDGLDIPEEHIEIESDTAVLTWIPRFTEDDIVVKVCAYSDGACEEVCPKYIRLKARDFENVAMRIMTDRDPSHMFCAGDTVNFWLATKNAGLAPKYTWYNDVFELPDEQSPKNELIHYESEKITMVMGQEDTWMRVVMNPSAEICIKEPVVVDTVFMKKKPWVEPSLDIDCVDTLVCRGDTVTMQAIYANAGENPTFQWQRSIGDPIKDWDLGTKNYATAYIDEQDVWVKCTMVPSEDVCYDASKPIVDAIKINVMEDNASVTIACDMEDKQSGDELIFEAEVKNILGEPRYEWYVNEMKAPVTESEYITNTLKQGDIVYCLASGERVCQTRVQSNLIVVNYGQFNRDTMLVIYKNESIKDLDMVKEGDNLATVLFKIETSARNGVASISPDGKFSYLPNAGFVGTDDVKYVIINRSDKSVIAEGYIYITVKENDRFFVPNLITPNDDGLNDTWKLDFLSQYPNHIIQVFNRDGVMVYEARNYQNDWKGEGMTKGGYVGHINLVNGIYTYVIDLGDKDKTVLKSWLEIRANLNRRNYR